jgi:dTDP-4-dehydrorhamnose reductase
VLVLGGTGMLGHKVWQRFRQRFDAWVTVRRETRDDAFDGLFSGERVLRGVTAEDLAAVERVFDVVRPTVVVNCVGIVKQLAAAADPIPSITINALFPQRVAALAQRAGARVIQVSTDCVFSGTRGLYSEDDVPDARDLYGRTKLLGEVSGPGQLTLRTSIIGRELSATTGLLEWFLAHRGGTVKGFTQAYFSGLTTAALAEVIADLIEQQPALGGVYHVVAEPISKYDLLCKLNQAYGAAVLIEPSGDVQVDRTLNGAAFRAATGLESPSWDRMITALTADPTPYEEWRHARV